MKRKSLGKTRGRKPKPKPYFFKPLNQGFTSKLRIPLAFVDKHGDILPENATLRASSGQTWNVKVEKIGEYSCFTEGWSKFAEDAELKVKEIVLFCFSHRTICHVSVFGTNKIERELVAVGSEPEDIVKGHSKTCTNHTDTGCGVGNGKSSTCIVQNEETYMIKNENGEKNDTSSDEIIDPHFEVVLSRHHGSRMHIPKKFCMDADLNFKRAVVLESPPGRYWPVELHKTKFRVEMTAGWPEFRKENKLTYGKTCSFVFNPSKNVIQVKLVDSFSSY